MPYAKKRYSKKVKKSSNTTRALALRALKQSSSIRKQIEVLHGDEDRAAPTISTSTVDTHLLIPGLHTALVDTEFYYKTAQIHMRYASSTNPVRMIVVQFPNHEIDTTALPAITDILEVQKIHSPYKKDSTYKYKILADHVFDERSLYSSQEFVKVKNITINSQVKMRYDSGATKYWLRNGVWIYMFHDAVGNVSGPALYKRLLYTDA